MRCEEIVENVSFILNECDMWRFTVNDENDLQFTFNPHGMSVRDSRRKIKNIIAINPDSFSMIVIHGYNHGTAIKEMILRETLSNRVIDKEGFADNEGMTLLKVKARCA